MVTGEKYYDEMPFEVKKVLAIQYYNQPVGLDTMNMIDDIIARNPTYFPWEIKYKSIPNEVHEAFRNECYPPKNWEENIPYGEGIFAEINKQPPINISLTDQSIKEMFEKMFESENRRRKEEKEEKLRVMKIWDKHYKKYNLEYRG